MIDPGLTGRHALVTGGAGNIGAAISRACAATGARVSVHHLPGDPAEPDGVHWAHVTPGRAAEKQFGPINVLVNNAAHCETPDDVDSLTAESLERHYRVNAIAPRC